MNALTYLLLRYRLWRWKPRQTLRYEPDHRSKFNTEPGTEWWRAYDHLAQKKDTNPNG